jgi:hypothetical protein
MADRVTAGPMPWNRQKIRYDEKAGYQYNVGLAQMKSARKNKSGRDSYTTGGWSVYSKDQWAKQPTKPEMVEMRLYNGQHSMVPIGDVQAHIGFDAIPPDIVPQDMADYAAAAFDHDKGLGKYYEFPGGGGHIVNVRYNPTYQVMEVTFVNGGTTVTFFRVPKAIPQELEHLARSHSMMRGIDGKMRHGEGIRFWDLVRIRGQRTGARYPFSYGAGNSFSGGSEQGKYAEMQLRTIGDREQQATDAQREATIVNTEQPDKAESAEIAKDQVLRNLRDAVSGGKFLPVQEKRISDWRDILVDKFSADSPAYREFAAAVERGNWTALVDMSKRYNLKYVGPKGGIR